jgi:hypothetical protein
LGAAVSDIKMDHDANWYEEQTHLALDLAQRNWGMGAIEETQFESSRAAALSLLAIAAATLEAPDKIADAIET